MRLVLSTLVLITVLTGCSSATPQTRWDETRKHSPTPDETTPAHGIRVTRDTTRGPAACHPKSVGKLVVRFLRAVNRGDVDTAMESFTANVGWYSITEGNPNRGGRH